MKRSESLCRYDNDKGEICAFVLGDGHRSEHGDGIEVLQSLLGLNVGEDWHYPIDLTRFTQTIPLNPRENVCFEETPESARKRASAYLVVRNRQGGMKEMARAIVRYQANLSLDKADPVMSSGLWDENGFAIATTDMVIAGFLKDVYAALLGKGEVLVRQGVGGATGVSVVIGLASRVTPDIVAKLLTGMPDFDWMQANPEESERLHAAKGTRSGFDGQKPFLISCAPLKL